MSNSAACPATHQDYARAAALLWGEAGEVAAAELARANRELFAGSVPPLPVVIGLAAYGHCIGLTRPGWKAGPRISLAPEVFTGNARSPGGTLMVRDVVIHELTHAVLALRGESTAHNGRPWCALIEELSPDVLGREVTARPVVPRRIQNPERERDPGAPATIVARVTDEGALTRPELAAWPGSLRPDGYYRAGRRIPVPTY
jgi:hypothetical protein